MLALQPELEKQADLCAVAVVVAVFAAVSQASMRGSLLVMELAVLKAVEWSAASALVGLAGVV